jgi:fumarate hydratase, class II
MSEQEKNTEFRTERDSMGEMKVPADAYYAAQTQRALENFPISKLRFGRSMINSLGLVKRCAATVNSALGILDKNISELIIKAASEVESGKLDKHFVVDIFQTGSGTSSNMNTNEVIANRAKEISGGEVKVHPNDHVNMCQSSNDVIPTAIHVATAIELTKSLIPSLTVLADTLGKRAKEFDGIVKTGRTHLQDATPIRLGQEFSGYESQIRHGIERVQRSIVTILELPIGGTAVGTGVNTHPEFAKKIIVELKKETGLNFIEATNHFEAQAAKDALVEMSGQLKTIACSMLKVANDIRWLSSGPRCGIGELQLPAVQPGSSIMPGKVNPVIAESVLMVCTQVIGNDACITAANNVGSTFELNVTMPVIAHNILESIELLSTSAVNFAKQCVEGLTPNIERLNQLAELSIATCTSLAPKIGYDKAAELAKEAFKTGKTIRELAKEKKVLPEAELEKVLDILSMTKPGL